MEISINKSKAGEIIKETINCIVTTAIVAVFMFLFLHFIMHPVRVDGSSMCFTLTDNDYLISNVLEYEISDPKRFDIITFKPYEGVHYIKRVIGLPGETVTIDYSGTIRINGEVLDEDFGIEAILDPGLAIEPITLGEDEYFVLGDNRNHSIDSRFAEVGLINRKQIEGRAICRIAPLNKVGLIN